jgi:hypothetical protein
MSRFVHCGDFLWGHLKSKVYIICPMTTDELKQNIREKIAAIPVEISQ